MDKATRLMEATPRSTQHEAPIQAASTRRKIPTDLVEKSHVRRGKPDPSTTSRRCSCPCSLRAPEVRVGGPGHRWESKHKLTQIPGTRDRGGGPQEGLRQTDQYCRTAKLLRRSWKRLGMCLTAPRRGRQDAAINARWAASGHELQISALSSWWLNGVR